MEAKDQINPGVFISHLNDETWFTELLILKIDRISLLCIIEIIELVLRHADLPEATRKVARKIGKDFALRLLADAITIPEDVMESWIQTFGI